MPASILSSLTSLRIATSACGVVALLVVCPVAAADSSPSPSPSPSPDRAGASIHMYWPDSERGTDEVSVGYDAFYERDCSRWCGYWRVRAFHEVLETTDRVVSDFYRRGLGGDLGHDWALGHDVRGGVFAGLGWVNNDVVPDADDSNDWFGSLGLQATSPWLGGTRLRVRGSLRANYDHYQGGVLDWQAGLSVMLPLR
ncbi:hypothetical protein [Marinobacter sp. JSM 1782161]|uniref:hypothetical protein n=1 Tax=Marinobacter sp. JSM 1782161 TaxID=2685906 RepID=UPI001403FBDD|nr:hypothetical protein [Marinobacter sp. JSM 1782161]